MINKIVSGGQTGVDSAALDVAIQCEIQHGGWCPLGRKAENGVVIPHKYQLKETTSSDYSERTKLNIKDSDGTLIMVPKKPISVTDGTILTIDEARSKRKPFLIVDLSNKPESNSIRQWVDDNHIKTLNIAGPRESQYPGIYQLTFNFLTTVIPYLLQQDKTENISQYDSNDTPSQFNPG